jgi:hypothetical protein
VCTRGVFCPLLDAHFVGAPTYWVTPFFAVFAALLDDPDQRVHRNSCLEAHVRTHLQPEGTVVSLQLYYAFETR